MKQVKLRFPVSKADEMATGLYEINFVTIVSYSSEEFFSGDNIILIGVFPEENVEDFKTKFGKWIIK